jgi:mono/diheme cytochrome c family protein
VKKALSFLSVLGLIAMLTCCQEADQPAGLQEEAVPVQATRPAAEPTPDSPTRPAGEGDPANGGEIYVQYCVSCHGPDAGGRALGPTLVSAQVAARDQAYFQEIITNGRPGTSMPSWEGLLSRKQIEDVIAYLRSKQ